MQRYTRVFNKSIRKLRSILQMVKNMLGFGKKEQYEKGLKICPIYQR